VLRLEQLGVPTYNELVFVANGDALDRDQAQIRRFMGAVARGLKDLRRNPDAAIKGLLKDNPDLDPTLQKASVRVTLPVFSAPAGKPFGWQDPEEWGAFAAWMNQNGILKTGTATGAFSNHYLPGQGL
jgi:putative hydroxymethylpyrimidine transport system substrate-binding protein